MPVPGYVERNACAVSSFAKAVDPAPMLLDQVHVNEAGHAHDGYGGCLLQVSRLSDRVLSVAEIKGKYICFSI